MSLLLRIEETADELRMSRAKVASMVAGGELPSIKIGRSRRVPAEQLREWVTRQLQHDNTAATTW